MFRFSKPKRKSSTDIDHSPPASPESLTADSLSRVMTTQRSEVAAGSLDFLLNEIVKEFTGRTSGRSPDDVDVDEGRHTSDDEKDIAVQKNRSKLESIGFSIGVRLTERYTKNYLRFAEELDVFKFICKDFWMEVFRKSIDNLRTNHRGVYVLQDNRFPWLVHHSASSDIETVNAANIDLAIPCGLLTGALSAFGLHATVTAEISAMPSVVFTVRIRQK